MHQAHCDGAIPPGDEPFSSGSFHCLYAPGYRATLWNYHVNPDIFWRVRRIDPRMLFNFSLAMLENIPPWGSGTDLHLSWFGLTDGCYWLRPGDVELFRYSAQLLEKAGRRDDYAG